MDNPSLYSAELQKLREGSHTAFNKLYNAYADSLYGFILLHTKSVTIAEDMVQDTFLKVWKMRETISIQGSFKAFLFTIARNQIIDNFRRQITKEDFEEFIRFCSEQQIIDDTSTTQLYYEDFINKLTLAKSKLTSAQQRVFELNREEGLSVAEIAARQKVSEQTVRNQLTSGLKIVREELRKYNFLFSLFI